MNLCRTLLKYLSAPALLGACSLSSARSSAAPAVPRVARWSVHEITLSASKSYSAEDAAQLTATFRGAGQTKIVRGFWDGERTFRIRFTPTALGAWSYQTSSPDAGLNLRNGSLLCTAAITGSHGFARRDAEHPQHFRRDDGTRLFVLGQTYYRLLDRSEQNWRESIDGTLSRGMNKIRLYLEPGQIKAHGELGLEHWRKLDRILDYMNSRGMLADLIVFNHSFGTPEQDAKYLRMVVARCAAFPSVAWTLVNEWNYRPKPREYWNRMGRILSAQDPWAREGQAPRMLSIHQQTRLDFQFFDQDWLSHAIVQLGVRNGQGVRSENEMTYKGPATGQRIRFGDAWGNASITANLSHNMPVVNDEYGYIGEPEDKSEPQKAGKFPRLGRDKHRQILWGIYAAGGYGSAGDKNQYPDGKPYSSASSAWHDAPEYGDIQRLAEFFTAKGIEYWKMASHNELKTSGERVYILAEPGRQYVIYAAAGSSFSINVAPGNYAVRRYDPRSGQDIELPGSQGGASSWSLPAEQDWVLYLRPKAA